MVTRIAQSLPFTLPRYMYHFEVPRRTVAALRLVLNFILSALVKTGTQLSPLLAFSKYIATWNMLII